MSRLRSRLMLKNKRRSKKKLRPSSRKKHRPKLKIWLKRKVSKQFKPPMRWCNLKSSRSANKKSRRKQSRRSSRNQLKIKQLKKKSKRRSMKLSSQSRKLLSQSRKLPSQSRKSPSQSSKKMTKLNKSKLLRPRLTKWTKSRQSKKLSSSPQLIPRNLLPLSNSLKSSIQSSRPRPKRRNRLR